MTKIGKICTEVFKLMEELVQARVANLTKNAAESMKQCDRIDTEMVKKLPDRQKKRIFFRRIFKETEGANATEPAGLKKCNGISRIYRGAERMLQNLVCGNVTKFV